MLFYSIFLKFQIIILLNFYSKNFSYNINSISIISKIGLFLYLVYIITNKIFYLNITQSTLLTAIKIYNYSHLYSLRYYEYLYPILIVF